MPWTDAEWVSVSKKVQTTISKSIGKKEGKGG
jgi:hypothetical protein